MPILLESVRKFLLNMHGLTPFFRRKNVQWNNEQKWLVT